MGHQAEGGLILEAITIQALTTVAGLAIFVGIVVAALRKALAISGEAMDRWGALLAIFVGVITAILAGFTLGLVGRADIAQDVLNGIFGGLIASGGFDVINGARKATIA